MRCDASKDTLTQSSLAPAPAFRRGRPPQRERPDASLLVTLEQAFARTHLLYAGVFYPGSSIEGVESFAGFVSRASFTLGLVGIMGLVPWIPSVVDGRPIGHTRFTRSADLRTGLSVLSCVCLSLLEWKSDANRFPHVNRRHTINPSRRTSSGRRTQAHQKQGKQMYTELDNLKGKTEACAAFCCRSTVENQRPAATRARDSPQRGREVGARWPPLLFI